MPANLFENGEFLSLAKAMSPAELSDILSGHGMWKTESNERLGIPRMVMTDGTYGVRYSIQQIDDDEKGGQDFAGFLNVVNQRAKDVEVAWGTMKPATCFPNGSSFACSWDAGLAQTLGDALGRECQMMGVHLLLGPGINIRRTPLGGRSYEYYSEDPLISGEIATGVINGLQQQGVGSSLKHFACNNSEIERTSMDSLVDERALREIYLRGFERAIKQSRPWTVMSSYNRLNGTQTAEDSWLLTDVLRHDWGFDGVVVADWHGIKNRPQSLLAGNDLDMPESETRKAALTAALERGEVSREQAEISAVRVLEMVQRAIHGEKRETKVDHTEHHALARHMVAESIVLLKNDRQVLPLKRHSGAHVLVVGEGAKKPVIQGSGCATTLPTQVDIPWNELEKLADGIQLNWCQGDSIDASQAQRLRDEACMAAREVDRVVVFANSEDGYDGEGSDRRTLNLQAGQDELISALAAVNNNVIVVLANPDAVVMPWLNQVAAVVETFYAGQAMGGGLADVLFGVVNPSGKLTVTFPQQIEDIPGWHSYPGENGRHLYSEGIFVGYRWYDVRNLAPLFPFGFGLSYTTFAYSDITVDRANIKCGESLTVSFTLTNTGNVAGKEISQLYSHYRHSRLKRPLKELRAFSKTELQPGESRRISFNLPVEDLRYYDTARQQWVLEEGEIDLCVGGHSRELPVQVSVTALNKVARYRLVARDTQPVFVLENPIARQHFNRFLQQQLNISEPDADRMLDHCANSFFGLITTFDRRFRQRFDQQAIDQLIAETNAAILQAESE
ncbi:glycoside hydrolase family 3 C-terminal domain-containing protein [Pantoea rwandensis]|uniref:Beta-D-glucoside glucohydrolase n=1 Tax=Pantoea rwandensis TaxID=1076550 RepID=A0A1X1D5N1_9GAMM|nr:glycoside hydrolase family 3 C-terminal domain-containing protein [Pantoea rwandensis]ORM71989.1 glycosyl hydrolase [Pantoea rwandensis]